MAPEENQEEGLTSLEALGIAVRSEMDAREIYAELADRCEEPTVRRRFELLAAEEEQHREYLTGKWKELAGEVPLKIPPSQLPGGMATREERRARTMKEVLDMAIVEERRSREFYLMAASQTDDPSGQAMFRYLADMEYAHWMTLAQERDLLLRYPNYIKPGATPWRPEPALRSGKGRKEGR